MNINLKNEIEELNKQIQKRLEKSSKAPDILYHYTDSKGLIGILEEQTIRMTNTSYLNDSSELQHGWEIITELIKSKMENHESVKYFLDTFINGGHPDKLVEIFVFSLCEKDDLLNQWRGYGASDGAFSIGIKIPETLMINKLFKVEYAEFEQKNFVNFILDKCIYLIKKYNINFDLNSLKEDGDAFSLLTFFSIISRSLVYFKNDAFKNEVEWRAHVDFKKSNLKEYEKIKFREQNGVIVPYLEFKISDTKIPIESIKYALVKDGNLTEKSIEFLLFKKGYDPKKINISQSKVPLRFK